MSRSNGQWLSPNDMERGPTAPPGREAARAVLEDNWRPALGVTVPHAEVYPWRWLWDSCLHAVVWAALDDERAVVELEGLFAAQHADGFLPHVDYRADPGAAVGEWGREGASTITQPPLFGHAARVVAAHGMTTPGATLERAAAAHRHLLATRRDADGLLRIVHPWESGCDDSPRWDSWLDGPWDRFGTWRARKHELVAELVLDEHGGAVDSPAFSVAAAGFNAIAAFDLRELATLTGADDLAAASDEIAEALDERWDEELATWVDAADPVRDSCRVRTLDALLPVLVSRRSDAVAAALASLDDPTAYGAAFGPRGLHRDEPVYDPTSYWRGGAWPQLHYLLWVAAVRRGADEVAAGLATRAGAAATTSGHAEYWNPEDGAATGAAPQSWATLWLPMQAPARLPR